MTTHYVRVLRPRSNRTYARILAGLAPEVARRYGYAAGQPLAEEELPLAVERKDWEAMARLSAQLAEK